MLIGALRSPLPEEKRVGITPDIVRRYLADGHQVVVEPGAGQAAGFRRRTPTGKRDAKWGKRGRRKR